MNPTVRNRPAILFFDVNETLLDLSGLKRRIDDVLLTEGAATLWFTTMLQYSLVMTVSDQYAALSDIGVATLKMIAKNHDVVLGDTEARDIVGSMRSLPAHPDVLPALVELKSMNFRLVALTNSSDAAVAGQLSNAGIGHLFERHLSVESLRRYKPHEGVYHWAANQLTQEPRHTMLVAAHGWDVAGAKWAGLQTAFVERPGQHLFPLGPEPDLHVADFAALVTALR